MPTIEELEKESIQYDRDYLQGPMGNDFPGIGGQPMYRNEERAMKWVLGIVIAFWLITALSCFFAGSWWVRRPAPPVEPCRCVCQVDTAQLRKDVIGAVDDAFIKAFDNLNPRSKK